MNIAGLNKAEVLAALYNASHQQGMGILHARGAREMTPEEAEVELQESWNEYFEYLHGRVMKISLQKNEVNTQGYNRDNGEGAAERAVDQLR